MPRKIKPVFQVFHPLIFSCADKDNPLKIADFSSVVPTINGAEFGFGKGGFIIRQALENPDKIFVAVEAVPSLFFKALDKAFAHGLRNLYLVLGDARLFFSLYLRDARLDVINFLFPDPWHKSRYHKHRMVTEKTVPYLTKILKDTGKIIVRSDNHIVIFDIFEKLLQCGFHLQQHKWNEIRESAFTEWESKAILGGRKILHSEFILPVHFGLPNLEPLFDIRQVGYRQFINGEIETVNNAENAIAESFNALSIPNSLLL